jgi:5-methylcytosine-specific restriction protein A
MPTRPPSLHAHPKRSEQKRKKDVDSKRESSWRRGYNTQWQKVRDMFLHTHALCEMDCKDKGLVVAAEVVDHIIPIAERPELRLDPSNLRAACKPCHDRRTAREQGFARKKR